MIIKISEAKNNMTQTKEILQKFSDRPQIDIILRDYVAYQGNFGYSGIFTGVIKELAKKACKNKQYEISKIIQAGMLELLEDDYIIIPELDR